VTPVQASAWFVAGFLFCAVITGALVFVAVRTAIREERHSIEDGAGGGAQRSDESAGD